MRTTLRAAIDRIIPADEFPSASEVGALDYFERILNADLAHVATEFTFGLAALDEESVLRFGKPLHQLVPEQQDRLLETVEVGQVNAHWPVSPIDFFKMLVDLTSEAYYADPSQGGNRDMVSWKMIGYDPRGQTP